MSPLRLPGTTSANRAWVQNSRSQWSNASMSFYRIPYCLDSAIKFAAYDGSSHAVFLTASFIVLPGKRFL
jgi:hypothetical protein